MPLLGVDSVFLCGAKSVHDFDDWDMPATNKPKKKKTGAKKPPAPTRTSQLREGLNSKEKRKSTDVASSLESSINNDELIEQQQRLENLEHKQEIQTLKNQNIELTKENKQLKELSIKCEQVDSYIQTEDAEENNKLKKLQELLTESERDNNSLQLSISELRTSKEATEKQNTILIKEREKQETLLQCAIDDAEKYKTENENLKQKCDKVAKDKVLEQPSSCTVVNSETKPLEESFVAEEFNSKANLTQKEEPRFEKNDSAELSTLKTELDNLSSEYKELCEKFDLQTFVATQLENVNVSLTEKNNNLESELNKKNDEINVITLNLNDIINQLDVSKKLVELKDDEINRLGESLNQQESQIAEAKELDKIANDSKNVEINLLKESLEKHKNELDKLKELEQTVNSEDDEINRLRELLNQQESELVEAKELVKIAEDSKYGEINLLKESLEKHENELDKLKELEQTVNSEDDEINRLRELLNQQESQLVEAKELVKIAEDSKNGEINLLKESVQKHENELNKLKDLKQTVDLKDGEIKRLRELLKQQESELVEAKKLDTKIVEINLLKESPEKHENELEKFKELEQTVDLKNDEINRLMAVLKHQESDQMKCKNDYDKRMKVMEEQLIKTRKQKDTYEDQTHELQRQVKDLTKEIKTKYLNDKVVENKEEIDELNISVFDEVQFEQCQNSASPFIERKPSSAEPEPEVKLLRQQIDEQQLEIESLETSFKSEVSEMQKSAEYQEQIISKLEVDNSQLRKQAYELNETILSHEDKIRTLLHENNHLEEQLQEQEEHEKEQQQSTELIAKNEREDIENLMKLHQQEIEIYKNKLNEYEQQVDELIDRNEKDVHNFESQLTALQMRLEIKSKDCKNLQEECELLRKHKEQEFIHRDEQELYLLREIERAQHDCRQRISSVEEDRDKQISNLNLQHEETMMEIELEYEQLKSNELEIVREDFKNQVKSLLNEREELLFTVQRLEGLLSSKKYDSNGHLNQSDSRNVYEEMLKSLSEERENHKNASQEMLNMLTKLEKRFAKQYENVSFDDLNNTWPLINQSEDDRTHLLSSSHSYTRKTNTQMRERLEKTRADISEKMEDLDNSLLSINHRVSTPLHHSSNGSLHDSEDGLHSHSRASSASSISYGLNRLYSSAHFSSPTLSPLRKDKEFSFSEYSSPKLPRKKHLEILCESFQRLEQQCRVLENENIEFSHESWYKDLQSWKQRALVRLNLLRQRVMGHDSEDELMNSVLFRPSDNEVRKIIADVNDKYDRMSNGLDEF